MSAADNGTSITVSIIVPAFNESSYIAATLRNILASIQRFEAGSPNSAEVIVVDNGSTDDTAAIAVRMGVPVVREGVRSIAAARNSGARASSGRFLIFVDADTIVPGELVSTICDLLSSGRFAGGAVATEYRPHKRAVRIYLRCWAFWASLRGMAQGTTQYATRQAFEAIGGYDVHLVMSEDVDFFRRLRRYSRARGTGVAYVNAIRVVPSSRRFDSWPFWKTVLWTNPLSARLFNGSRRFWYHWYDEPPR